MQKKTTVCFVLPDLSRGGAQRIMSFVASSINKTVFESTLIIVNSPEETDFKVDNVNLIYLNKKRLLNASYSLYQTLTKNKFDIIIGSIGHINKILGFYSLFINKSKFIGREASVNTVIEKYNKSKEPLLASYLNDYRKRLDAIVSQSEDMTKDLIESYNLNANKVFTINNPLTFIPENLSETVPCLYDKKELITIGRLSEEKGHKRIIENLSKIDLNWHYTIIGDGIEKENIIQQINQLNLQDKITLKPYINDVSSILPNYDLFIQGSFVEGFPNATLESCVSGTPVIAFNAPGGTKEIITNNVNGYIVNDEIEFQDFLIKSLTEKKWDRKQISNSVIKKFNSEHILSKYQELFTTIISN